VLLCASLFAAYLIVRSETADARRQRDAEVDRIVHRLRGAIPVALEMPALPVSHAGVSTERARREEPSLADRLVHDAAGVEDSAVARELLADALLIEPSHVGALRAMAERFLSSDLPEEALRYASRCVAVRQAEEGCALLEVRAAGRLGTREESVAVETCLAEEESALECALRAGAITLRHREPRRAQLWQALMRPYARSDVRVALFTGEAAWLRGQGGAAREAFEYACARGLTEACDRALPGEEARQNTLESDEDR